MISKLKTFLLKLKGKLPVISLIVLALFALWFANGFARNYLESWAMGRAKKIYEEKINKLEQMIQTKDNQYYSLSEKAGKDREEFRKKTETEINNALTRIDILRGNSAANLRRKDAQIAEILSEKEKDEAALRDAGNNITALRNTNLQILRAWEISDQEKDKAHKEVVDDLKLKYTTCQRWTETLEKRLRPTLWGKVKKWAGYSLAFGSGYALGRGLK